MKTFNVKYLALSCLVGVLFSVFIYNLSVPIFWLKRLYDNNVLIYTGEVVFNFFLFRYLYKRVKWPIVAIFAATITAPILIDSSVLITTPNLIPLRFPFATIFPILGASLAVLYLKARSLYFKTAVLTVAVFMGICYFIIPKLAYYGMKKSTHSVSNTLFNANFYTVTNQPILLKDTSTAKCAIIECFFSGCSACEIKKHILLKIREQYNSKDLDIVFICAGSITKYSDFLTYNNENKEVGITFLYDRDSVLEKEYKINRYPFEMFSINKMPPETLEGFNNEIKDNYYNQKIISINNAIRTNIHN